MVKAINSDSSLFELSVTQSKETGTEMKIMKIKSF